MITNRSMLRSQAARNSAEPEMAVTGSADVAAVATAWDGTEEDGADDTGDATVINGRRLQRRDVSGRGGWRHRVEREIPKAHEPAGMVDPLQV